MNFNLDLIKCFSKILLKPDDQLELDEAQLKQEHTRILSARNPHAPDNLITFDFNAMNFTPGPAIEHMETNYKRMVSNTNGLLTMVVSFLPHDHREDVPLFTNLTR